MKLCDCGKKATGKVEMQVNKETTKSFEACYDCLDALTQTVEGIIKLKGWNAVKTTQEQTSGETFYSRTQLGAGKCISNSVRKGQVYINPTMNRKFVAKKIEISEK